LLYTDDEMTETLTKRCWKFRPRAEKVYKKITREKGLEPERWRDFPEDDDWEDDFGADE